MANCVGFPWPPKLTLCIARLCAFDSQFPRSTLCITELVWTCFGSPCWPSASRGLCAFVSSHCLHSLSRGLFVLLSAVQGGLCVLPKSVCLPSIGTPVPLFALAVFVCRLPEPTLCAARIVCAGWVCMPHHSVPGARTHHLFGATVHELLRAEKYSFLCLLPFKSLLCLVLEDFPAPLWAYLLGSFPVCGNSCFRVPSLS